MPPATIDRMMTMPNAAASLLLTVSRMFNP